MLVLVFADLTASNLILNQGIVFKKIQMLYMGGFYDVSGGAGTLIDGEVVKILEGRGSVSQLSSCWSTLKFQQGIPGRSADVISSRGVVVPCTLRAVRGDTEE